MTRITLPLEQYEPLAGTHFNEAVKEATSQSRNNQTDVYFDFNGVSISINNDDANFKSEGELIKECSQYYHAEMDRKAEEYRNSPEGIEAARQGEIFAEERIKKNAMVDAKISDVEMDFADVEKWNDFVSKNKDGYGGGVISFAKRWAKLMQVEIADGAKIEDIAQRTSHDADNEGITGFMYGCAVSTLAETWEHGEDLRKWHNKKYQPENNQANDNDCVVNPAVLTIRQL